MMATPKVAAAKGKDSDKDELSVEDKELVDTLELLIARLKEADSSFHHASLVALKAQMRESAAATISIPKALKYLKIHYTTLKDVYGSWKQPENRALLADMISVLAMSYEEPNSQECLAYRVQSGVVDSIEEWGHEYIKYATGCFFRHLAMNISSSKDNLAVYSHGVVASLTDKIVEFFMTHNAEPDACDLLYELERLPELVAHADEHNFSRIVNYLLGCAPFETAPDDLVLLEVAFRVLVKQNEHISALYIALKLNNYEWISQLFAGSSDENVKKQMALIIAKVNPYFQTNQAALDQIIFNLDALRYINIVFQELQIKEAKAPDEIFKTHLQDPLRIVPKLDSAKQNLASTFVNCFVNAANSTDKVLGCGSPGFEEQAKAWVFKHKDTGIVSAVASIGMICQWNPSSALELLNSFLYSDNVNAQAGAALGIGISNCGVKDVTDTTWALLREFLEDNVQDKSSTLKSAAMMGADIASTITPMMDSSDMQTAAWAAISLGHIFCGTADGDISSVVLHFLMELSPELLDSQFSKIICIGLATVFIGQREASTTIIETLQAIEHPLGQYAATLVEIYSFSGTGDVLQIQKLLHKCTEIAKQEGKIDTTYISASVIGISLIAMSEEIGKDMAMRLFGHMMHYGDANIKKTVPLATALLFASHPSVQVVDILGKYSHDHDRNVVINSIFAMGIVGAGTNNAKLAQALRQLAAYHAKDSDVSFAIKLAQGLLNLGKGIFSLNSVSSNKTSSFSALSGLLIVVFALSDCPNLIADRMNYLMFFLSAAVRPKFLVTVDERLEPLAVPVRVGQAVDVVGQAGKPKTITGFQTHSTPVLLSYNDKAEMATEEYIPLSSVLEGVVILRKNPNWTE